jgi:uncharacterized protein (TIGR03382 family)
MGWLRGDGNAEVFAVAVGGALVHSYRDPSAGWQPWGNIGSGLDPCSSIELTTDGGLLDAGTLDAGTVDAGYAPDAGPDAGADAGPADAGEDAGSRSQPDAGGSPDGDAGSNDLLYNHGSGCGCAAGSGSPVFSGLLLLLAAGQLRRRRRPAA